MSQRIQQAIALLRSIATGDAEPSTLIHPERYIQHNLTAPDGLAGFLGLQKLVSSTPNSKIETIRGFEDGDYVFLHTQYAFFGQNLVGFDIFRFEGEHVVEHWDNLQPLRGPNPDGHSMVDGPVDATDLAGTDANKALVRSFIESVLIGRDMSDLGRFFEGDRYIQHNPGVADGVSGFLAAAKALAAEGKAPQYSRLHLILGQGDFVLAVSEGSLAGVSSAFFDLFRIENGKIAEHWDTVDLIPPREAWKNANGKF